MYSRNKKDEGTDLLKEMDSVVRMPGWSNIWTQPIINRIDMLATGVRTKIGVKVFGNDLDKIQKVSEQVAEVLQADSRRPSTCSPIRRRQGIPGDRHRPREGGPLRRQRRRHPGRDRNGAGRQGDHHDRRGPRAIPGAHPLRPGLPRGRRGRQEPAGQAPPAAMVAGGMGSAARMRERHGPPASSRAGSPPPCRSLWLWSPT